MLPLCRLRNRPRLLPNSSSLVGPNCCVEAAIDWLIWVVAHTHTRAFNGPFSGTTQVSRYQKGKTNLDFTETVGGSGISWAICKSAPRCRQITMPAPHHSVFYRPDALPAAQPTASKHWRPYLNNVDKLVLIHTDGCTDKQSTAQITRKDAVQGAPKRSSVWLMLTLSSAA